METLTSAELAVMFYTLTKDHHDNPHLFRGVKTGLLEFDAITGGLQYGWYIVIGGPQKMGKSALLMSIAIEFAKLKVHGLFASFEMANEELAARVYANFGDIDGTRLRDVKLDKDDWESMKHSRDEIGLWNFYWNYGASHLGDLLDLVRKWKPRVLFVDYLQLMSIDGFRRNRQEELSTISRELKRLTMTTPATMVIAAAQLNRESIKQKLWDSANAFRDTGSIEQDCNLALIISPIKDGAGYELPTKRAVNIVASRHTETGKFILDFAGAKSRFSNEPSKKVDVAAVTKQVFGGVAKPTTSDVPW